MSQYSYTISKSSPRDVARLGQISASTFDNDRNTQVKIMCQKPGAFAKGITMGVQYYTDSANSVVMKATDDRDGKIVGFTAWGFRGVDLDASQAQDHGEEERKEEEEVKEEAIPTQEEEPKKSKWSGKIVEDETIIPGAEKIKALEEMTSKHLNDTFAKLSQPDGSKRMFVGMTAVDPAYQNKGVGSQLMSWGTARADRLGASILVHSSEAGWSLFEKHGFKEVERLTFDLDEYAVGPPPKDGAFGDREKWGQYTFRYGLREPKEPPST